MHNHLYVTLKQQKLITRLTGQKNMEYANVPHRKYHCIVQNLDIDKYIKNRVVTLTVVDSALEV